MMRLLYAAIVLGIAIAGADGIAHVTYKTGLSDELEFSLYFVLGVFTGLVILFGMEHE